jgi:hypothetical protein
VKSLSLVLATCVVASLSGCWSAAGSQGTSLPEGQTPPAQPARAASSAPPPKVAEVGCRAIRGRKFPPRRPLLSEREEPSLTCPKGSVGIPGGMLEIEQATTAVTLDGRTMQLPPRHVHVAPFCLDRLEVSESDLLNGAPSAEIDAPHLPALLGFVDAQAHCAAQGGRLPTVAEWVTASIGQLETSFPWGNEVLSTGVCWQLPDKAPLCPVGSSENDRTVQGVMDLIANATEWATGGDADAPIYHVMGIRPRGCSSPLLVGALRSGPGCFAFDTESVSGFRCVREALPPNNRKVIRRPKAASRASEAGEGTTTIAPLQTP